MGIEVDVRDHGAVEATIARVVQEWGRVDVLVANAGGGRGRPVDTKASTLDPALLQLVTEMNLFGTIYCCNAVAPIMKQQRSGEDHNGKLSRQDRTPPSIAAMLITGQRKPLSPITRGIWRRISGRSASPSTASLPASSRPRGSWRRSFLGAFRAIVIGPNWSPFGGSVRLRIAPRSSSFWRPICPTM